MADANRINGKLFFQRGIDAVLVQTNATQSLPDQSRLAPADRAEGQMLERLLGRSGLDALLDKLVSPDIVDRNILLPGRFRELLDEAHAVVRSNASDLVSKDPESAKILARADRLLNQMEQLDNLLGMYSRSLYGSGL
jgi:hypothetical protein